MWSIFLNTLYTRCFVNHVEDKKSCEKLGKTVILVSYCFVSLNPGTQLFVCTKLWIKQDFLLVKRLATLLWVAVGFCFVQNYYNTKQAAFNNAVCYGMVSTPAVCYHMFKCSLDHILGNKQIWMISQFEYHTLESDNNITSMYCRHNAYLIHSWLTVSLHFVLL